MCEGRGVAMFFEALETLAYQAISVMVAFSALRQ